MTTRTLTLEAIKKNNMPTIRYTVSFLGFNCSDSFTGRSIPSSSHFKDWQGRFKGFRVVSINSTSKNMVECTDIKKQLPEAYTVMKAFKAKIEGNKVLARHNVHGWLLFKIIRHYMHDNSYYVLSNTASLIKRGFNPLTAYMMSAYSIHYRTKLQSGIMGTRYIININSTYQNRCKELIYPIPYTQNIDDYINVLAKTYVLNSSIKFNYTIDKISRMGGNAISMHDKIPSDIFLNDKKVVAQAKKFKKFIKAKNWKAASKMIKNRKYWKKYE